MISLATLAAYGNADYIVDLGDRRICLRAGERSAELDAFLESRKIGAGSSEGSWAFLTACNPRSTVLDARTNESRQAELETVLSGAGFEFSPGRGECRSGDWPGEPSLLVLGVSVERALELARQFEQHAFVAGTAGTAAMIVLCEPDSWRDVLAAARVSDVPDERRLPGLIVGP